MDATEFYGTFDGLQADPLRALAREYHDRCEAYDRTICTGGADAAGVVHPTDYRELGLVQRNGCAVMREVWQKAQAAGFSWRELCRAVGREA